MKNNNFFIITAMLAPLLCANASFATTENKSSDPKLSQSISAVQSMSNSMQKINSLLSQCHLEHDCILKGLERLANEKNALAQSMLNDFKRNEVMNSEVFTTCYKIQKSEVDTALMLCMAKTRMPPLLNDKTRCYEEALIKFVNEGNTVAEQVLFTLYQLQHEAKKLVSLQEKLNNEGVYLHQKANKRCLERINEFKKANQQR